MNMQDRIKKIPTVDDIKDNLVLFKALLSEKELENASDTNFTEPADEFELTAQIRAMPRIKAIEDMKNEQQWIDKLVKQRTKDLEYELKQSRKAEKKLKDAFDELEQQRKAESVIFEKLKVQAELKEAEYELMLSRESFQNYFENCSVGMSVTSAEKVWLEVNHSLSKMLGYSKEELEGLTWIDITFPEDVDNNLELFSAMAKGLLDRYEIDKRFVRKDGSIIYTSLSTVCERNPDGSIHHLLTSYVDVTARKLAEEAIIHERALLRTLIDNLPDIIYVKDLQGRKILANKADLNHMGYISECEILGKTDKEIFSGAIGIRGYEEDITAIRTGKPLINQEKSSFYSDGIKHWRLSSKFPFFDENHKVQGLVGIGYDITERKKVEDELRILSQAVEQNPASIVITNTSGQIQYVNPKFSELTGYSSNEIIGENPRILKSNSTSPDAYTDLWKTILAGGEWRGEFKNKKKSGEEYFETALISPIKDGNGQITHFLAVKEDITRKKKDEILIRKLSQAIGQSPVSIIITDDSGKIEFVNSAFTILTQYAIDEVINKPPRIFNPGHTPAADFDSMWENLITGKIWKCEYLNRRKDGSTYWEDVTISSLMNSEGAISNYILIMDNISEKKKMLDDLITAKETAEESNRLKSAFLATMNHELRTPLNHILGFSELIMAGTAPEENICFASNILVSGQNLLSIIEGIFDLALVENTDIKLRTQTFSLIDQFMENKASFDCILRTSDKHEQIQLIFRPDTSSLSRYVTADRSKINQALNNLFKNAVKFTHKGTIEFGYKIENESNLVFYVKDSGIGIPQEKLGIIFDYFRQGDDSFTRHYGGIGIGLAISQRIAKLLNGELTVVSEPGQGSTFSLSIPVELSVS